MRAAFFPGAGKSDTLPGGSLTELGVGGEGGQVGLFSFCMLGIL